MLVNGLPLAGLTGCFQPSDGGQRDEEDNASQQNHDPVPVEVVNLTNGPIEETLSLAVSLEAEESIKIFAGK